MKSQEKQQKEPNIAKNNRYLKIKKAKPLIPDGSPWVLMEKP